MPVNTTHPNYDAASKKWALVRDIVNNDAKKHLPDVDSEDIDRNKRYKDDAVLLNFTNLTKNGLLGLIFLNAPQATLPPELQYFLDDATGTDLSLDQLIQKLCGDLLQTGRYGLLADYQDVTRIVPYAAESIINWRTEKVNGKVRLIIVVLKESVLVQVNEDDPFYTEAQDQYRALVLDDGIYKQEVYNKDLEKISSITPTKADGSEFDYIPFVFIGSEDNDADVDNATLYDLAMLNLSTYKNSADLEESIFITGQPTVVVNVGDIPPDVWKEVNGDSFKFGSRGGHIVGLGGNAVLLQANANQLAGQAIKDKLIQAVEMGGRLISPPGGRETAESVRIRFSSANSALFTLTKNVNEGVEEILEYCCDFEAADPSLINYELNDQFYEEGTDVPLLAQSILMFDRNIVSAKEIRNYIQTAGAGLVLESDLPATDTLANDMKDPLEGQGGGTNTTPKTTPTDPSLGYAGV